VANYINECRNVNCDFSYFTFCLLQVKVVGSPNRGQAEWGMEAQNLTTETSSLPQKVRHTVTLSQIRAAALQLSVVTEYPSSLLLPEVSVSNLCSCCWTSMHKRLSICLFHLPWFSQMAHHRKQEVVGRTNRLLSFDMTHTAQKMKTN
jgi:hypothetical protein